MIANRLFRAFRKMLVRQPLTDAEKAADIQRRLDAGEFSEAEEMRLLGDLIRSQRAKQGISETQKGEYHGKRRD